MKLTPPLEKSVLLGALGVQPWDPLRDCRIPDPCVVTALRPDGTTVATAVRHSTGIQGFLKLRAGSYRVLTVPQVPQYLPSLRSATIPMPAPAWLDVMLHSSSAYAGVPYGMAVLRGTLQWGPVPPPPVRAALPPVRWATIYASVESADAPGAVFDVSWTRSSARGEFALFVRIAPPHDDGVSPACTAHLEVHAGIPASPLVRADDDYRDLPLDDGADAVIRAAMPLRFSKDVVVAAGDDLSINQHVYDVVPPGSAPAAPQNVIVIT
jgi:hypothetical protein